VRNRLLFKVSTVCRRFYRMNVFRYCFVLMNIFQPPTKMQQPKTINIIRGITNCEKVRIVCLLTLYNLLVLKVSLNPTQKNTNKYNFEDSIDLETSVLPESQALLYIVPLVFMCLSLLQCLSYLGCLISLSKKGSIFSLMISQLPVPTLGAKITF